MTAGNLAVVQHNPVVLRESDHDQPDSRLRYTVVMATGVHCCQYMLAWCDICTVSLKYRAAMDMMSTRQHM